MTSATRACPSCATPLPAEAQFCFTCGKATPTEPGVPPRAMATGFVEVSRVKQALAGRYTVERVLGEGGMATVYLATDERHHRKVAVKVMRPELAATLGTDRFLREVKIAAQLSHPHILPMYDSGEADGLLYYVMPHVEGETLYARLKREIQLPVEDAVRLAREVAEALEYAHQRGIIHRDIKPANILLQSGHALVADFGIARAIGGEGEGLTATGIAIGTPHYMSPEQASGGRDVDARTDVYALGAMLYEMLAGEPPFTGPTAQAIISRALTEEPRPLTATRRGLPPQLDAVVSKALAKNPADRIASAGALATALASAVGQTTESTPAAGAAPSPVLVWGLFSIASIGALAAVATLRVRMGLPAWSFGLAVLLLAIGAGVRLAVLPFDNLGDSTDAYFADGVANEVRTKLTALPSMQVTARASSMAYKGSTQTPAEIARDLGVDYLLTGTVQWQKGGAGANRVHVTPELIQVSSGASTWQQSFDASLTDVFKVQADIASQVASALGVALGAVDQQKLAERPTQNLSAYDAFLRGEAASQGLSVSQPASLRQAIEAYEQAVALDSTFVQAWAQLSRANSRLYQISTTDLTAAANAKRAADRALALAPSRPEGHQALGQYYIDVKSDNARGFSEDSIALTILPSNAELMATTARAEYHLGRWEAARRRLEEAAALDPRSIYTADHLGRVLLYSRQSAEARRAIDRAMQISPGNFGVREFGIMAWLAEGNLARARSELQEGTRFGEPTGIVAYIATYYDLMWLLDDGQQQLLVRLTPSAFDNDRGTWALVLAQTYALRGDQARTRIYADSAQYTLGEQLKQNPTDPQLHVLRGLALAYLGRKAEAVSEGEHARMLLPIDKDEYTGGYVQHQFVRILVINGDYERAIDQLEPLLRRPYFLTPAWLRIDPNFVPLKGNPRFERLLAG